GEALTGAIAERIEPRWLCGGVGAMGCLFFAFSWSGSAAGALLFLEILSVANGFTEVVMMTAIHEQADDAYQGRVFGVGSTIWRTTMLGAVALAPAIDAVASPPRAFSGAGYPCRRFTGAVAHRCPVLVAGWRDPRSGLSSPVSAGGSRYGVGVRRRG